MTSLREVGLLRLVSQGLVGAPTATGAVEAVRQLLAVQAQDLPGALVSVALRTGPRSRGQVVAALDDGSVVRSWPLRGTLHLVPAEDLGWLLRTTAVRTIARFAGRRTELGLDEGTIERARELAESALASVADDAGPRYPPAPAGLRRAELMQVWEQAGVATSGQRGYHLMAHLAQTGTLCLGPTAGAEQLFVRPVDWVRGARDLHPDEALGELAGRYLTGHGPATLRDLTRWAGLTLSQARTGLAVARGQLVPIDVEGVEHWLHPGTADQLSACRDQAEGVLLLPGFDEYLLGYGDRGAVLAPEHAGRVAPGRNGVFRPTVVDAGQVVGTWRHVGRGDVRTLEAVPFEAFRREVDAVLGNVHGRLPR